MLDKESGFLYGDLFDLRQRGDYGDFYDLDEEEILNLIPKVNEFLSKMQFLIKPLD